MGIRSPLIALALGVSALGSGCLGTGTGLGTKSESKKPDVTQPGVLPPPQVTTAASSPGAPRGPVVPASATATAAGSAGAPRPAPASMAATPETGSALSKMAAKMERKVIATEMAVGWQNRVAYLPDPVRNGQMSPGLVGQLFLFGGAKLEFAQADGTLTVDLIDDSPRPAGQPAATPERWQFDKATLRKLQTRDETFGKSYVLFLPWPAYKSDVTRVRISARYDPDNGHTLFAAPATITLDTATPFGAPVFTKVSGESGSGPMGDRSQGLGAGSMTGMGGFGASGAPNVAPPNAGAPIPLGGAASSGAMMPIPNSLAPAPMMPIPNGGALPIPNGAGSLMPVPNSAAPMMPIPNGPIPIKPNDRSAAPPAGAMPGTAPNNAPLPEGLAPLTFTMPGQRP